MQAGLRVDVDTLRGTLQGVPRLLRLLDRFCLRAVFFFCVGPDNMGRHLWRLLKPAFLWKMLRTNAPALYGWNILRCGVIGRGPDVGRAAGEMMRQTLRAGHEVGLHAWDHHRWQSMNLDAPGAAALELRLGYERLTEILDRPPSCSAAPAWRAPEAALLAKDAFPFAYNSDCRGASCFIPRLQGRRLRAPQVPVTLPTYDELMGRQGVSPANYNQRLLDMFRPDGLNVLCVHAEVEGLVRADLFERFLTLARERDIKFTRLDEILAAQGELPEAGLRMRAMPGREGCMAFQEEEKERSNQETEELTRGWKN
ncbi:MAG: 4-deoxy-4-formamido-L-arabinose-phosphoundecaprenol deformylase [Deltaproteobacteria bacterium]|jgi:undecaprenyl phosphate-alpha-L-ara4FN deformylase|nr:4-deoxy-4-formamido-L-arabinose-phosphoundecaprenol deformylase [Deltaproteobacteria bacterium]